MIILGVDLGKARTGLALCDKGELLASPLCVLREHNRERLVEAIAAKAKEAGAQLLAVGLPRNMDGTEGESAQNARDRGSFGRVHRPACGVCRRAGDHHYRPRVFERHQHPGQKAQSRGGRRGRHGDPGELLGEAADGEQGMNCLQGPLFLVY